MLISEICPVERDGRKLGPVPSDDGILPLYLSAEVSAKADDTRAMTTDAILPVDREKINYLGVL